MRILNNITKYRRMSSSDFYKSFPLLYSNTDSTFIERVPCVLDLEVPGKPRIDGTGVEERWLVSQDTYERIVTFKPHDFLEINHLDLAESYFRRSQGRSEVRSMRDQRKFILEQHDDFLKRCKKELLSEIVNRIRNNSYSTARYIRVFIRSNRTFDCLENSEVRRAATYCLKRLFERQTADLLNGNVVVEVFEEFFTYQLLKEDLVSTREFTAECLDYVLACCSARTFNARRFLNFDNQSEQAPFCPISSCILCSSINIQKLRVLIAYGFEPLMVDLNVKQVLFASVKLFLRLRYSGKDSVAVSRNHIYSTRRIYIVLKFLYLVCCSLIKDKEIYVESSKILFSSIPDPFVSRDEIYRILPFVYHSKPLELTETFDLFRDTCIPVSMPRTLKHLSRWLCS